MIFFLEGPIPFHHTSTTLDIYGASPPPYWNAKYATGWKHPFSTARRHWDIFMILVLDINIQTYLLPAGH